MLQLYPSPSIGQSSHHILSCIPHVVPRRFPFSVLATAVPTLNFNAPVTHFSNGLSLYVNFFQQSLSLIFLENEERNGNLHGHIVRVNEAHQQSRMEDPDEVPLEEQITTVNEGRPLTKRIDTSATILTNSSFHG